MGGKVWSYDEERYFWRRIIPHSKKRLGIHQANHGREWKELAPIMQSEMGDLSRRRYTGLMLFEHYFQNIEKQRVSPNASVFVREYTRRMNDEQSPDYSPTPPVPQLVYEYSDNENEEDPVFHGNAEDGDFHHNEGVPELVHALDQETSEPVRPPKRKHSDSPEVPAAGARPLKRTHLDLPEQPPPDNQSLLLQSPPSGAHYQLTGNATSLGRRIIKPKLRLTTANLNYLNQEYAVDRHNPTVPQHFRHSTPASPLIQTPIDAPVEAPIDTSFSTLKRRREVPLASPGQPETRIASWSPREEEDLEDGEISDSPRLASKYTTKRQRVQK